MPSLEQIARLPLESYNRRNPDHAAAVIAQEARFTDVATGEVFTGPEGFRESIQRWLTAFPDGEVEIRSVRAGADFAVVQYVGRGANTGPLASPTGTLPATGRYVELAFCDVVIIRDGKIQEAWSYYDSATMIQQLGLAPPTPSAATV